MPSWKHRKLCLNLFSLRFALAGVACAALIAFVGGCPAGETPDPPGDGGANARDCVGCHTDETLLKAVARTEEPPQEDSGEG